MMIRCVILQRNEIYTPPFYISKLLKAIKSFDSICGCHDTQQSLMMLVNPIFSKNLSIQVIYKFVSNRLNPAYRTF